ncbi:MAG TPA: 3-phosphoshikimate 1-carboxyvinyltransferase, partial [Limnochordia bacterium]|nr:3-phosphoshikimate 1-carboxyvinyltransferase [Limnochordia bacterium]
MDLIVHRSPRLTGRVAIGGSKNYTARYVLAASLAEGESLVQNPAPIDDAAVMIRCCRALGAEIREVAGGLAIRGTGGRLRSPGRLDVGNAGAVTRFLLGVCATIPEPTTFVTPYPESLGKRPHGDLLDALAQLGADVQSENGRLPVTVARGRLKGGPVRILGSTSSQFTTALLFMAPLIDGETVIEVEGELVSQPALEQTLAVLGDAGIELAAAADRRRYVIPGGQRYRAGEYRVPGDWPAASAILAAAACTESDVTALGLMDDAQGERACVDVLAAMGARVAFDPAARTVRVQGAPLKAVDFDGDPATDAVLALAAAMCFAQGTST